VNRHAKASSAGSSERRASGRKRFARLAVATAALLALPTSALASTSHHPLGAFGSANEPSFVEPLAMAVEQSSGDLLVIDGEANTISRWNPDGSAASFSALGSNVIDGEGAGDGGAGRLSFGSRGEAQVAVDESDGATDGDIYVTSGFEVIDVFAEDGSYLGKLTESSEGEFGEPCGVAVDPSGNVYIGDFSGVIHKFEPAANPPVNADNSDNFPFEGNCTLAAGAGATAGFIFPTHYGAGTVAKLDAASGEEKYEFKAGGQSTVSVDPADGHLYATSGEAIKEFDASGSSAATEVSSIALPGTADGVAVSESSGDVYATVAGDPNVEVFGPLLPGVPLTVKKGSGGGEGTLKSNAPGIDCGPACPEEEAEFGEGGLVKLKASPASNSTFAGWSTLGGNPGTCTATTSPCEVTMSEATGLQADFALRPQPALSALSEAKGPTGGANLIEITGSGLAEASKVQFGNTVVEAPFAENTATKIKLKVPGHGAGTVDVTVTTGGGTSAIVATGKYTFVATPAVTALSPGKGPTTGGNTVEITGLRLGEATSVQFGETTIEAPFAEDSATTIKVKAPPHPAGTVDVRVTTLGGTSANFANDDYDYEAPAPPPPKPAITPPPALAANSPPPLLSCLVPRLKGLSLAKARSALSRANCTLGKVRKPKAKKLGALVVKSSSPAAGASLPAGGAVGLKLAPKQGRKS
jgi:hypothetical protein